MQENNSDTIAEIWLRAWLACATSANVREIDQPARWADACVKEYSKRFLHATVNTNPEPEPERYGRTKRTDVDYF